MRLMTLEECAEKLDPDRRAGIKARTLRSKLATVRVGRRELVPEPVFEAYCEELLCHARTQGHGSPSERKPDIGSLSTSSDGTSAGRSASWRRAQATAEKLKRRSETSSTDRTRHPAAPVVPIR